MFQETLCTGMHFYAIPGKVGLGADHEGKAYGRGQSSIYNPVDAII